MGGWDEVAVGAREASLFLFLKNEMVMLSSLVRTPGEQGLREPRRQERKLGGGICVIGPSLAYPFRGCLHFGFSFLSVRVVGDPRGSLLRCPIP